MISNLTEDCYFIYRTLFLFAERCYFIERRWLSL